MKISYNWLKQYCNINLSADKVSKILTDIGLEVEGVHDFESVKGGFKGIVVGEVKTRIQHPNADRLSVTTVDLGNGVPVQIVCGAPNVAAGQKVIVATVGCTLYPSTGEPFQINKSKIRGEVSEGMICAEDEIGLGESHAGIMVLDPGAVAGTPASEYFKIENDIVFEIGLTPNRVDAASHIGVARDLIAALNFQLNNNLKINWPSVDAFKKDNDSLAIPVIVEDTNACPRYSGVTINNIKVAPSPEWLQNRLRSIGVRPINNIVDITNFVLFETGQPLHAFDAAEIKGGKVLVKKLAKGTPFVTLDGLERKLLANDLMICNAEGAMCIAGVYGGEKSGVKESTTAVFLESAYFDAGTVRKTSKAHNLKTDAAFRFERGVDPNGTLYALKRAALLIKEIAGGEISSDIIDIYPNPVGDTEVAIDITRINRHIGVSIGKDRMKSILSSLDITVKSEDGDKLVVKVPPYKVDVKREADITEEVLRIYGYNNIPMPGKFTVSLSYSTRPDKEQLRNVISDMLSSKGFNEIMSLSLTNPNYTGFIGLKEEESIQILNPLSKELEALRQSLVFSGLEAISYNKNRRNADLKLYEIGKEYKLENGYKEEEHLALFVTGRKIEESWNTAKNNVDFYFAKSIVANILERMGVTKPAYRIDHNEITESGLFQYGMSVSVNKVPIINVGLVKKSVCKQFDIAQDVFYASISLEKLFKVLKNAEVEYEEVSKYPTVRRDLSMILAKEVKFSQIEQAALQSERNLLKEVNLFDVYEGKNMDADKKSYAVSFTFSDPTETLTDKRIEKSMERIMQTLEKNLGAVIRK